MPYVVTMLRAMPVAFSMSLEAPVLTSPKISRSATQPPNAEAIIAPNCTREARRGARQCLELNFRHKWLVARMHRQDRRALFHVWVGQGHLAVESARPQQRWIEHVGAVRRGQHDDMLVALEAVHLDQNL